MVHTIGYWLYLLGTQLYFLLVRLLSPFHLRARQLWQGQKGLLQKIIAAEKHTSKKSIWFHVPSLGEFEQGRPVMEALKQKYPQYRLVVTISSPSGYAARQNDSLCDAVYFLPFELKRNAEILLDLIKPVMAIWVKYDFWYAYLNALKQRKIPVFLIAAQFRSNQIFFKPYGVFKRNLLRIFNHIFCQNENSIQLLHQIHINNCSISGDNRFDRVLQTSLQKEEVPYIKEFCAQSFIIIAGSSYSIEESMLAKVEWSNQSNQLIVAPHFVQEERILELEKTFEGKTIRYSKILETKIVPSNKPVLIIDSIGLLSRLYQYAHLAFIGGGFVENGLHNCLEAATFGMPICFGPKLRRFPEAQLLVQEGIGTTIEQSSDFIQWFNHYSTDKQETKRIAAKSRAFVESSKGATEKVMFLLSQQLTA